MTSKDYIVIADGISDGILDYRRKNTTDEILMDFAFHIVSSVEDSLHKNNSNFKYEVFRNYIEERICDDN